MKYLIGLIVMLLSFNVFADNCTLKFEKNPDDQKIKLYTLYLNGEPFVTDILDTPYTVQNCLWGDYTLTASNSAGESTKSIPHTLTRDEFPPSAPKIISISHSNVIINLNVGN